MVRLRMRAPVRPGTPPQLKLNLDFGTQKQREDYARDVLQQVFTIEAARAQQGFGSAFVSADDKEGAINDAFAEAREEMRWHQAQARRPPQTASARSNPEPQRTEQKLITFHPQPRQRPPQSARPAAASTGSWDEDLQSPPRPRTSMGTQSASSTFLTGTDFEEREPGAGTTHAARPAVVAAGGSRPAGEGPSGHLPPSAREDRMHAAAGRVEHAPAARGDARQSVEMWERAERAPLHTTMDASEADPHMAEARARWCGQAEASQAVLGRLEDYVRLDRANRERVDAEAREDERQRLTMAHYSQKGLPYVIRASADMTSDRLGTLRDSTAQKKGVLGGLVDMSINSRTPGEDTLRQTITDAIREDNKVLQRVNADGRVHIAPPSAAALRVSEPGPIEWAEPCMPWQRDPVTGDWYRADKVCVCAIKACVHAQTKSPDRRTESKPRASIPRISFVCNASYAWLVSMQTRHAYQFIWGLLRAQLCPPVPDYAFESAE